MTGTRIHAPLLAAAFGVVWAAALSVDRLGWGGLAPLAAAAVVAAALGGPFANLEWRTPLDDRLRTDRAVDALGNLWSLLLLAALAAAWVAPHGLQGALVAICGWLLATAAARLGVVPIVLVLGLAAMLAEAGGSIREAPPWTLLEPHWGAWRDWLPASMLGGLMLAGAGFGQWRRGPFPPPGSTRLPWLTIGLVLSVSVLIAIILGTRFEAAAGLGGISRTAPLLWVAAAAAVLHRWPTRRATLLHTLGGLAATFWFAGPAHAVLDLTWGSLLPAGPALVAAHLAWRTKGGSRALAAVVALLLAGAAVAAWPGLPKAPLEASAAALTVVAAVWIVGTRALLRRST